MCLSFLLYQSKCVQTPLAAAHALKSCRRIACSCCASISRFAWPHPCRGAAPAFNSLQRGQPSCRRPNTTAWLCFVFVSWVLFMSLSPLLKLDDKNMSRARRCQAFLLLNRQTAERVCPQASGSDRISHLADS